MAVAGIRIEALGRRRTPNIHVPAPAPEAGPVVGLMVGRSCAQCPYRDVCAMLVKAHLPVLCERLEREESERLREAMKG